MRTIQKQISLEPIVSRLPSVWPAYFNNDNEIYYFDDVSLSGRSYLYTSNWGMTPLNVIVTPIPYSSNTYDEYSLTSGCHCYGGNYETSSGCSTCGELSYDEICDFTLSFNTLSNWYYFFVEYYNLLKNYGHCNRVYTSAEDYYNYESGEKYYHQMIYGSDKQTYLDLDKEFAEKGGRVVVLVFNKDTSEYEVKTPEEAHDEFDGNKMEMADVYDIGFFKWMCDNVVPSFIVPLKYREYWKRDVLFYPDIIKWLAWFGERLGYEKVYSAATEGDVEKWDCKSDENIDCCDCEEYFNRGGERIYNKMLEWYENVQQNITTNNEIISANTNCFVPTIIMPIELQTSIDDLGQFSILSNDYELGKDYRVGRYGDTENTYGGTVATIDGDSMYLDKDGLGYAFDEDYMEKRRDEEAWTSYTERYINNEYDCNHCGCDDVRTYNNRNEFDVSAITFYAYDENNVKYVSSSSTIENAVADLQNEMAKIYQISFNENGWILIGNNLYEIKKTEYASGDTRNQYTSGNTYLVLREGNTNTPYTIVNGKTIFADFYLPTKQYYFTIFPSSEANFNGKFNINNYQTFERTINDDNLIYYISYNGGICNLGSEIKDTYIIDGIEYPYVSGFTLTENNDTLYIINDTVQHISQNFNEVLEPYEINGYEAPIISSNTENESIVYIRRMAENIDLYSVDEITGKTVSKIYDLRLFNTLTDDIGNNIDAIYEPNENIYNHQPPEGSELELIYQVGNTANIRRYENTFENIQGDDNGRKYFVGDIITNMTFYYVDYSDNIVEDTIIKVYMSGGTDTKIIENNSGKTISSSGYTSLSAITMSTDIKNNLEKDGKYMYDDINCNVTYYIGATLSRVSGMSYMLSFDDSESTYKNYGVEYNENVKFIKTNKEYYLKKKTEQKNIIPSEINYVCNHSISYPVCVYELHQDLEKVVNSQYDSDYSVAIARFRADINVFSGGNDTYSIKYDGDMATHNNMEVFPVYVEEYKLGLSSIENIDSDIYIDRGINAAFEKHLKLGEVKSLEDLENYGGNFFKMMES